MGTIFTLSPDIREVARILLDDMIEELGKIVRLVYEPTKSECPNCLLSPINNRSSGIYQSGGPLAFEEGQPCPVCSGEGWVISASLTEDIQCGVAKTPKDWFIPIPPTIVLPAGMVQLKTYTTNWAKVKRARHVILAPDVSGFEVEIYRLHSSLGDPSNLVPGRYCVGFFERVK